MLKYDSQRGGNFMHFLHPATGQVSPDFGAMAKQLLHGEKCKKLQKVTLRSVP